MLGKMTLDRIDSKTQYGIETLLMMVSSFTFAVPPFLYGQWPIIIGIISSVVSGLGMAPMFITSYVAVGELFDDDIQALITATLGSPYNLGGTL
jgi:MFS family permease